MGGWLRSGCNFPVVDFWETFMDGWGSTNMHLISHHRGLLYQLIRICG